MRNLFQFLCHCVNTIYIILKKTLRDRSSDIGGGGHELYFKNSDPQEKNKNWSNEKPVTKLSI